MSRKYNTLEDFLISKSLSVDIEADDGWGAKFPVKGIELEATVLFADIAGFTKRTANFSPTEILIFINTFFSWLATEVVQDTPCIVDKYVGDEVMIIFSKEFGSDDPFKDALNVAKRLSERDILGFRPHIGIASGTVMAGYIGTPVKYNASLFGRTVNTACRCASIKPNLKYDLKPDKMYSSSITVPATEWRDRNLEEFISAHTSKNSGQSEQHLIDSPHSSYSWELYDEREVAIKNMGSLAIRQIINYTVNHTFRFPQQSAEERARATYKQIIERS